MKNNILTDFSIPKVHIPFSDKTKVLLSLLLTLSLSSFSQKGESLTHADIQEDEHILESFQESWEKLYQNSGGNIISREEYIQGEKDFFRQIGIKNPDNIFLGLIFSLNEQNEKQNVYSIRSRNDSYTLLSYLHKLHRDEQLLQTLSVLEKSDTNIRTNKILKMAIILIKRKINDEEKAQNEQKKKDINRGKIN